MKPRNLYAFLAGSLLCATFVAAQAAGSTSSNTAPAQDNVKVATSGKNFTCDYMPKGAKASAYVPYALCWNVVCDTTGPNATKASCKCPIYNGPGWGTVPCDQRAAAYQAQDQIVYSEFSARYLLQEPTLQPVKLPEQINQIKPITVCQNDKHIKNFRYADCWNKPCKPNADGKTANCDCEIIYPKTNPVFMTEADDCKSGESVCQTYAGQDEHKVVNGADLNLGPKIVTKSLDYYIPGKNANAHNYFVAAHCEKENQ